jgi:N utilization substance protein B
VEHQLAGESRQRPRDFFRELRAPARTLRVRRGTHPRRHRAFGRSGFAHQGLAHNWEFERIAKIDLAILRLAMFEMLHRKDIPPVVSINEAIDLSKQFSNADSKRFINGILDRLKDQLGRDARKVE